MDKDPFDLRSLPRHPAPAGLWQTIETRLDQAEGRHARGAARYRWPAFASAAVLVIAVAVGVVTRDALNVGTRAGPDMRPRDAIGLELAEARHLSALFETSLAQNRGNVLGPDDVAELVWIESELRLTDELLADRPDSTELWIHRARLLDQMNRRYATNDWRAQMRLTSY